MMSSVRPLQQQHLHQQQRQPSPQQQQPPKKIWQPLHPDVRGKLDPQYVRLHDELLQYVPPDEARPWDGSARRGSVVASTGVGPVPVGRVEDVALDEHGGLRIRVYTPSSSTAAEKKPAAGWPVFVWFHGGGFALGNLASDEDLLTRVCQAARCVVCTIDYRLAPEHPYPAAVEDGIAAVRWLASPSGGIRRLGLDATRMAIGGASSGGTLSAVTALHLAAHTDQPQIPFMVQVLVVPVIDNTASPGSGLWRINGPTAPWLTPERMLWYRRMWLPHDEDAVKWDASPNRASPDLLARLPTTFIAIAEQDLLAPEGLAFGEQMRSAGVEVHTKVYPGCTHGLLTYCGKMDKGMEVLNDCVSAVKQAFS